MSTVQLEGNVGDLSTVKTKIPAENSTTAEDVEENSKVIYLNDSYGLDRILLGVETTIYFDDNE